MLIYKGLLPIKLLLFKAFLNIVIVLTLVYNTALIYNGDINLI
jgi:hypothetical protein